MRNYISTIAICMGAALVMAIGLPLYCFYKIFFERNNDEQG